LILGSLLLRGQSDNQQRFNVSGTVVNSLTNEPIAKALVQANEKMAMSDAAGHFEIDGVAGPNLMMTAHRPGFDMNNRRDMKIAANLENVGLKLVPLSKISGRVVDGEGEPVEGAVVQCISQQIMNGRKQWQPRGSVSTDETGSYLIEDLSPGSYILTTREKQVYSTQPKTEAARFVYPATYYSDAPSRDLAQRLTVAPGAEMRADITLKAIRGARVTMTTVPPSTNIETTIGEEDGVFGGNPARATKSGELVFPAVPPGSWTIVARGPFDARGRQSNEPPMYGEMQVNVGTADIDNLKLPLNKMADIPVTVSGVENPTVFLNLFSKAGRMTDGTNQEPDGGLVIRGVSPGSYRVVARSAGGNCVTSMMSGSADLLHDDLVVSAGASVPPIQVVMSSNCAQLTVKTSGDQATAVAIVTSENKEFEPLLTLPNAAAGGVVKGLTEGDYKVCAFDDISGLEYANPDALSGFKCQAVHLEAGQKATVQLEVNERRPQ